MSEMPFRALHVDNRSALCVGVRSYLCEAKLCGSELQEDCGFVHCKDYGSCFLCCVSMLGLCKFVRPCCCERVQCDASCCIQELF